MRRLVSMAYLYAWGPDGDHLERSAFRDAARVVGYNKFSWDGTFFTWEEQDPSLNCGQGEI
jgi:hypothetical protein